MIRINLLPVREARRKAGARQQLAIIALGIFGTLGALGSYHFTLLRDVTLAENRLRHIEAQIKRYEPQVKEVEKYKQKKQAIASKIEVIQELDSSRSGPVRLLDELSTLTPERLWLTRLSAANRELVMEGLSLDNEIIASFLTALAASPYFTKVELDTSQLQTVGSVKVNGFKIRAHLTNPAASKGTDAPKSAGVRSAAPGGVG